MLGNTFYIAVRIGVIHGMAGRAGFFCESKTHNLSRKTVHRKTNAGNYFLSLA
jgi:hypothetical protein